MTPSEAFQNLIGYAFFHQGMHSRKRQGVPGEIVALQSPETRQALTSLTASDVNDVREEKVKGLIESVTFWQRIARRL